MTKKGQKFGFKMGIILDCA